MHIIIIIIIRNHVVDFVEICNICAKKAIIKAAKRIINSDKICRSYSDLNFGVTFLEHSVETQTLTLTETNTHTELLMLTCQLWLTLHSC